MDAFCLLYRCEEAIIVRDLSDRSKEQVPPTTTAISDTTTLPPPPAAKRVCISHYTQSTGWGLWRIVIGWRTDGYVFCLQYGCEQAIVVRDLSDQPDERDPDDYRKFCYDNTAPAGREDVHRNVRNPQNGGGGLEVVFGWYSDGHVFLCLQYRCEQATVVRNLSDRSDQRESQRQPQN